MLETLIDAAGKYGPTAEVGDVALNGTIQTYIFERSVIVSCHHVNRVGSHLSAVERRAYLANTGRTSKQTRPLRDSAVCSQQANLTSSACKRGLLISHGVLLYFLCPTKTHAFERKNSSNTNNNSKRERPLGAGRNAGPR